MVKSEEWIPKGDLILEEAALAAVKDDANSLVIAGPGSGKTELLAQKLDYLFSTNKCIAPRKILALCFKTDAASNLKERVKKRYGNEYAARFTSLTYSAFEKMILDQFKNALPKDLRPSGDYRVEDWETIEKILDYNEINTASLEKNVVKRMVEDIVLEEQNKESIKKLKKDLLKGTPDKNSVLLYKQITQLATQIISTNEYIRKALQMTYEFVFLDEFQDTTHAQYNFLKVCFLGSSCKLTAVGDDKQAIMRWAGAKPDIFPAYIGDFNSKKYELLKNHRSVLKLFEFQKQVHQILDSETSISLSNELLEFKDGEITLFEFQNEAAEAEKIAIDIESKIKGGIRPSEICILAKQKVDAYSIKLIRKLRIKGIKARIENEYQEILKDPTCSFLLDVISRSQGNREASVWESSSKFYRSINGIDEDSDELAFEKNYRQYDDLILDIGNLILNQQIEDEDSMLKLINCVVEKIGDRKIISNFSIYNGKNDLDGIIKRFSKLLYKEHSQSHDGWKDIVSNFRGDNSIPIMTIHKSKGLEYKAVYFLGLEDSAFWNFKNQPEEDKSAFFVALSRAKHHLIFTYCRFRESRAQATSTIHDIYSLLKKSSLVNVVQY